MSASHICLPLHLVGHDSYTVSYMGWDGVKNGRLLALAAGGGFEVLITTDRNLEYQQNLVNLPLAVVVSGGSDRTSCPTWSRSSPCSICGSRHPQPCTIAHVQ